MPKTIKLMFDGVLEECLVREGETETVCYAKSGRFAKFPNDVNLAKAAKRHNENNKNKPAPPDDAQDDAELAEWLGG